MNEKRNATSWNFLVNCPHLGPPPTGLWYLWDIGEQQFVEIRPKWVSWLFLMFTIYSSIDVKHSWTIITIELGWVLVSYDARFQSTQFIISRISQRRYLRRYFSKFGWKVQYDHGTWTTVRAPPYLKITDRSFYHQAPALWNSLPKHLRALSSISPTQTNYSLLSLSPTQFHKQLKTYLFLQSYPPKTISSPDWHFGTELGLIYTSFTSIPFIIHQHIIHC